MDGRRIPPIPPPPLPRTRPDSPRAIRRTTSLSGQHAIEIQTTPDSPDIQAQMLRAVQDCTRASQQARDGVAAVQRQATETHELLLETNENTRLYRGEVRKWAKQIELRVNLAAWLAAGALVLNAIALGAWIWGR